MKNIILLIAALILFVSQTDLNGSVYCPSSNPNVYQYVFTKTLADGCTYEIIVCYECTPAGMGSFWIHGWTPLAPCTSPSTPDVVFDELNDYVKTEDFLDIIFTDCIGQLSIPPCDGPTRLQISYYEYICWMKENLAGQVYYVTCDYQDVYCYGIYEYCIDSNNEVQYTLSSGPSVSGNPANCPSLTVPSDPSPGNTSSCFRLPTLCFP